ncbi:MAG TPA: ISNCY family transposase [Thermodesulfobacteriota bacterium]|nr:ISNCY family transposase [Thermodesulfobacteriota bacterium]HNU72404.1 ISNCY family transposase [Thermodesulfobacteriota bacterium]HQO79165.1 ISNCY family transposase [Thermodesulfobacteriota bacterium]
MAGEDRIEMSVQDLKRLKVLHEALKHFITQRTAGMMLGLSERQVRRLIRRVREEQDRGVIHRGRGRPSNNRKGEKLKQEVLSLYRQKYEGFGPTLASEKLLELDGIALSDETVRRWLLEAGLWKRSRKRAKHRHWRPRKECFGQMVQLDGSEHEWLEGRGPLLVLMGYIDDATNTVFGRFYDYEGTLPALDSFKRYVKQYGLPLSLYLDKHRTYKSAGTVTVEQQLAGVGQPLSQFERAVEELGVRLIHADSPQAKGRIERLFGVLQDRLIKEMRLKGIKSKEEANTFLERYLPVYNRKFSVVAANVTDAHLKLPHTIDLDRYLCIKTQRTVRNDNTIGHNGLLYQLEGTFSSKHVTVEERVDGSLRIRSARGVSIRYREIVGRPPKAVQSPKRPKTSNVRLPAKDHPWRQSTRRMVVPQITD